MRSALLSETGESTQFVIPTNETYVLMVVGKWCCKTTTIGKLAYQFKKPVIMLSLVQLIRFVPQQLINCKFGRIGVLLCVKKWEGSSIGI
jgi:hypothetical protein